jgi:hypothetical protein
MARALCQFYKSINWVVLLVITIQYMHLSFRLLPTVICSVFGKINPHCNPVKRQIEINNVISAVAKIKTEK